MLHRLCSRISKHTASWMHCLICTACRSLPMVHQPAPTAPSSVTFSCSNHSSAELRARETFRVGPTSLAGGHLQSAGHLAVNALQTAQQEQQPSGAAQASGRALLGLGWNAAPSFSNDVSSAAVSRRHVFVAAAMLLVVGQPLVVARACWGLRQTCCTGFAAGFPSTLLHGCHCLICTARRSLPMVLQPAPTAPSSFAFSCSNHSSAELRARGLPCRAHQLGGRATCRALATWQSIPCRRPSRNSSLQAQPRQPLVLALRTEGCGLRLSFIALQD